MRGQINNVHVSTGSAERFSEGNAARANIRPARITQDVIAIDHQHGNIAQLGDLRGVSDRGWFHQYQGAHSIGPAVVIAHSQGGFFAWNAAQRRPDAVRALVLVEPASIGDPAQIATLRDIPVLMIYGDYIREDARWPDIRARGVAFAEALRAAGGTVDIVDLPERGITGNSHMIMMDRNSDQVAALVQGWLAARGLWA